MIAFYLGTAAVFAGIVTGLLFAGYVVAFSWISRRDDLHAAAQSSGGHWTRRSVGTYVRDGADSPVPSQDERPLLPA